LKKVASPTSKTKGKPYEAKASRFWLEPLYPEFSLDRREEGSQSLANLSSFRDQELTFTADAL
jgi:hypothetical protein